MLSFLGLTRPNTGTLPGERINNKQRSLQWDAYQQAKAFHTSKQTPRTTVKRHCVVARQHLHTAVHTVETFQKLKFEVLAHPPYSPDLAPSDYHLFGSLKEALRGCRFTSDNELKEVVHAWLTAQPKMFFSEGIKNLVQWWKKCIEKQGDYVKKLCYYKFSIFIHISLYL